MPTSCHPKSTTKNLPFSAALRIVRICTDQKQRDLRLGELKTLLMARKYNESLVDTAIAKAVKIPRKHVLQKSTKQKNKNRPIFATKFDPRLPHIQNLQNKHWRAMVKKDQYLAEVFPQPPMTGFRKQRNLKNYLIKAKVPPPPPKHAARELKGMSKCGKQCANCPYIKEGNEVKINNIDKWKINKKVNCETYNCVYMIECQKDKCKDRYIGQTKRRLKDRIADHRNYIVNQVVSTATGAHYNLPGHSLADMKVTILEQVRYNDELYREEREQYCINKFNTFYNGLNREK